jgi:hypothetical protein
MRFYKIEQSLQTLYCNCTYVKNVGVQTLSPPPPSIFLSHKNQTKYSFCFRYNFVSYSIFYNQSLLRVGIAQSVYRLVTGWTAGVQFPRDKIPLFFTTSKPNLGPTQPPIQRVSRALSLAVKRQERESDHSPPSSSEIKNGGAIPPLPIYLHGIVLN